MDLKKEKNIDYLTFNIMRKLFNRAYISIGLFFGVDIICLLSDALHETNKRNMFLTDGIMEALNVIPNNIWKAPEVTILENTLYNIKKEKT